MLSAIRTIEQERANYAWQCINGVKDKPFAGEYRTIVIKMPSLILTNGLGQALAYLRSKPERQHFKSFYEDLSGWLKRELRISSDLLEWIVNQANSQEYRLATAKALALLQWFQRFAEAVLPKGRGER